MDTENLELSDDVKHTLNAAFTYRVQRDLINLLIEKGIIKPSEMVSIFDRSLVVLQESMANTTYDDPEGAEAISKLLIDECQVIVERAKEHLSAPPNIFRRIITHFRNMF